jgi:phosphate starvation-inducible protein PhoH
LEVNMVTKRATKYKNAEDEARGKQVPLDALNENQAKYLDALRDHQQVLVFGPSGVGKTYLAATFAANLYLAKVIDKIVITRPNVSVGKSFGALPGTLQEKVEPLMYPVVNTLIEQLGRNTVETAIKNGNIELSPLEYMRGRSFKDCFMIADECFTPETEILTDTGFVRFDELRENFRVAQYDKGNISFVYPDRHINKDYDGNLVSLGKTRFNMTATEGHRAIYHNKAGEEVVKTFAEHVPQTLSIPVAGVKIVRENTDPLITLSCAIQADGSYLATETSAGNFTRYWTITLSRQQKIDRLRETLQVLGIQYSEYKEDKKSRIRFYIPDFDTKYFKELKSKTFSTQTILEEGKASEFLDEVLKWDGSIKGGAKVYCSTNKDNIDTIQICAHLTGHQANFGIQYDTRPIFKVKPKPYYRLNISDRTSVSTQNLTKSTTHYKGKVHCVTVPSGFIIVRQQGKVFISGNCQNLTIAEMKMLVTRVGDNCKLVMNGDIKQSDIKEQTGLGKAIHLAKKYEIDVGIVEFDLEDIVRGDLCRQWLIAFDKDNI